MSFPRTIHPIVLVALLLALVSAGCAGGKFRRSFGIDYPPRPDDWPVAVTFDSEVGEDSVRDLGGHAASPPPSLKRIGWAYGEAPSLGRAFEIMKREARRLGGDAVHVDTAVRRVGCAVSGYVYRGPPERISGSGAPPARPPAAAAAAPPSPSRTGATAGCP